MFGVFWFVLFSCGEKCFQMKWNAVPTLVSKYDLKRLALVYHLILEKEKSVHFQK